MDNLSKSLSWFWVGIGALGIAIGYFVGLSQSPVIATLLPLLFGLIGGSSGFLIARIKPDNPDSAKNAQYTGVAFVVFSTAIIISSFLALSIQYSSGHSDSESELTIKDIEPEMAMKLIAIRKQLEVLDASKKEQKQIIHLALQSKDIPESTRNEMVNYLGTLSRKSAAASEIMQKSLTKQDVQFSDDDKSDLESLTLILKAIPPIFQNWIQGISEDSPIPAAAINKLLSALSYNLGKLIGESNSVELTTISNLSANPELLQIMLELHSALLTNVPRWQSTKVTKLPNIDFEVSKLTSLLLSKKETNIRESDSWGFAYVPPPSNLFDSPD